ncbi:MAG: hypothetical protein N2Z60_02740 [Elusimicrobiales bacterium]|nr:hypothetical protein [Elusimicrobiales bacterium]
MKNLFFIFYLLFFCFNLKASVSIANKKYSTYLDLSFMQNTNLVKGSYYGGGEMNSSFGMLFDFNEKNSLALNYNILYSGPSVVSESGDLKERTISQSFTLEWQKKISEKSRVRPQLFIGKELRKSGSIGDFDDNLYNNNSKGFGLSLDRYVSKNSVFVYSILYRKIEFPNYTDLLTEFRNPGSQTQISGGLYDNNLYRLGIKWKYRNYFLSSEYTIQKYVSQKVMGEDGLYSDKKQKDGDFEFKAGVESRFYFLSFYPSVSVLIHRSNQNFLRFKSFTDMYPVFIKNAYDYNEYYFSLPSYFKFIGADFNFSLGYKKRYYAQRPPRNENNDYIYSKKQTNDLLIFDFSFSRKINELASVMFFFSFVNSSSNNDYDIYIPLNYNAASLGFGYRIKY